MPVVETVGRSKKSTNKLLDIFTSTVMDSYKKFSTSGRTYC